MKRLVLFSVLILAVFMVVGPAIAQDEGAPTPRFSITPSFSVGYIGDADEIVYTLDTGNVGAGGIGGVNKREYTYRNYSSFYIEGALSAEIGNRLGTEIITRWALPANINDVRERDFNGGYLGGRDWKTKTVWSVLEGNVSYDIMKDPSGPVSFAPKVGVRWDYWSISYDDPFNVSPGFAVASPTDTADFRSSAVMPFAGFTTTIRSLRHGMLGGDLVIDAEGGPLAWGEARHKETRDATGPRHDTFEGNLDKGYFYEISVDYTVLTLDFSPKVKGTVGLFGKMSAYHVEGDLDGLRTPSLEADEFTFVMDRSLFLTGLRLAITFDIFGKPQPVPPPAPAPVIEPKLEPMSKN
jgi:hypothetical protein